MKDLYHGYLNLIMGKTIAIVYCFEGDNSLVAHHFYTWKSNIISKWMEAVQDLQCMPLIIDVRTFIDKAFNQTLPHIDFVVNLNTGIYSLSTMALIPSVCSSMNIPCIPCNAATITIGEEKNISNYIAMGIGLNVPEYLQAKNPNGIFRPLNLGNSIGVALGNVPEGQKGIYQRFIAGYDITTPIVYNVQTKQMDIMPTVLFYPINNDPNWYYSEQLKHTQSGYIFKQIYLDEDTKEKYLALTNTIGINAFCRIDARLRQIIEKDGKLYAEFDDTYFIEINVMPTIRANNSFNFSYESIDGYNPLYSHVLELKKVVNAPTLNTFLLSSSMLAHLKTMY